MAKTKQYYEIKAKILRANEEDKLFTAKPVAVFYPNGDALGLNVAYNIRFDVSHSTLTEVQETIIEKFNNIGCLDIQIKDYSKLLVACGFDVEVAK